MREINLTFANFGNRVIPIGTTGENLAMQVKIDCSAPLAEHSGAHAALTVNPPSGGEYTGETWTDGTDIYWKVQNSDLLVPGRGNVVLSIIDNLGMILETAAAIIVIQDNNESGALPKWLDDLIAKALYLDSIAEPAAAGAVAAKLLAEAAAADAAQYTSAAIATWLEAHPEATTTVQDGAITRAKLDADLQEKTDAVNDLKSAMEQIASAAGQIEYYGAKASSSYRTLTYTRDAYTFTVNGTSDATIKIRLSGSVATAISSSYPDSWTKTIPLTNGRRYRIASNILSGSFTGTIQLRLVDNDNTQLTAKAPGEYADVTGAGKNALIYLYFANGASCTNLVLSITLEDVTGEYQQNTAIQQNASDIAAIQAEISDDPIESSATLTTGKIYASSTVVVGSAMAGTSTSSNGRYTATPVDISLCAGGGKLEMSLASLTASSTTCYAITDENNIVLLRGVTSDDFVLTDGVYRCTRTIEQSNAKYLYLSNYKGSTTLGLVFYKPDKANQSQIRYVSPNGSDDNDGRTSTTPMATINKALESGGRTIMLAGGVYRQNINLSLAVDSLRLMAQSKYTQPVICAPDSLITESETAVADTTKVYSCPCTKSFDDKNIWIFQDGVPDAATEIADADRHPLQRGKQYRCPDTKIVRCSAATTENAIAEIEAASGYKWFIDTTEHVLYFSRPQTVTASNPICGSFGSSLFANSKRGLKIEMTGVGVKYQKINLTGLASPILTDCFVGNVRSEAGIQYDGSAGAKLYRCEAFRVFYSTTSGDGINAHSETSGDAFAKQTGSFQIDCWSHDNCDDGYSDHERCETTIIGGLYENNGAGVTPAQGSHCTCYNVLSRYNGEADFFYTGNPSSAEGGVGGQIACYGCVAKGKGVSGSKGYRLNGSAVQGLFVGCVAIDHGTGFYGESGGGTQVGTLINCSTVNCTTQKSNAFTSVNGTPVT